jgi:hypothetical protein
MLSNTFVAAFHFTTALLQLGKVRQKGSSSPALPLVGPLTHLCFYVEGHAALSINHRPFPTARAYFLTCAEREHTVTHVLFTQGARIGAKYQALLAEMQGIVERATMLLIELVHCCEGLDSTDPELTQYALNLHKLRPKNVIITADDLACIVSCSFPLAFQNRTLSQLRIQLSLLTSGSGLLSLAVLMPGSPMNIHRVFVSCQIYSDYLPINVIMRKTLPT